MGGWSKAVLPLKKKEKVNRKVSQGRFVVIKEEKGQWEGSPRSFCCYKRRKRSMERKSKAVLQL